MIRFQAIWEGQGRPGTLRQFIAERRGAGWSCVDIAAALDAMGIPVPPEAIAAAI